MQQTLTRKAAAPLEAAPAEVRRFLSEAPEAEVDASLRGWGCAPPVGDFIVGNATLHSADSVDVQLWDSEDRPNNRWPHRARVRRRGFEWEIESILALCTGCFGTGWLDDDARACDICDGSGWGVGVDIGAPPAELFLAGH